MIIAKPELTYRGLDFCDGCGAALVPVDRLSGLCPKCRPPARGSSRAKSGRRRREARLDRDR